MASVRKALKDIAFGSKPRRPQPRSTSGNNSAVELELVSLPNALPKQYPPLILIHVILLSTALVLLPQTPIPNLPLPPPARGLDKPQHPFLAPITARPVLTLAWACLGAALLIPWWAGSLRRWAHDGTLDSRSVQQRLAGDPHIRRVRLPLTLVPLLYLLSPHPHLQDIWNACVFTAYATLALHVVIVLFGAPFIQCVFLLLSHSRPRVDGLHSQVCATYCNASFAPRLLHHIPSRIRAWPTAPWPPTPFSTHRRCRRAKRPLGADICGTRVRDFLEPFLRWTTASQLRLFTVRGNLMNALYSTPRMVHFWGPGSV